MIGPYKFSETATPEPPSSDDIMLLEKAQKSTNIFGPPKLTRAEKNRVAELLWGLWGAQSNTYKRAGWAWSLTNLPLILVKEKYDERTWHEYHAPDKTSLRKALRTRGAIILKMAVVE